MKNKEYWPPNTFTSLFTWESLIKSNNDTPSENPQTNLNKALGAAIPLLESFVKEHGHNFDTDLMVNHALNKHPNLVRSNNTQ